MLNRPPTQLPQMLFVALLIMLAMLSPVFAQETQTAVLYPTDDAYVDMGATGVNFGSNPLLEVSWSAVQTAGGANKLQIDHLSYLKFDLSVSEDTIVKSALLKLYVTSAVTGTSDLILVPGKSTSWNETTITGKNVPDVIGSEKELRARSIYEAKITKLNTWYSLDATSYVRSVGSGLISLMLIGGNTQSPWRNLVQFCSKESKDPALRPYLEVTYSGTQISGGNSDQKIVYLTLQSSIGGGSVYFNGTEYQVPNDLEVILDVPTGLHSIGVSPTISISDREKAVFQKWNDGSSDNPRDVQVIKSMTLKAEYLEQYYLNVTTQYGAANGVGWYGNGSTATLGVSGDPGANPPRVQAEGIQGLLGVSNVFDHWSGYTTRSSSLKVKVDGPETVTAIWREDYGLFYSYLIRGAVSVGAGFVAAIVVRRRVLGASRRIGMSDQLRAGVGRRHHSLTLPSIESADPRPIPVSRRSVAPAAPTRPPSFTRVREPARAPISVATAGPASPTRRYEGRDSVDSLDEVRGRRQLVRGDRSEPARVAASTTVIPGSPMGRTTKFCRECGVQIWRDSKYCEECGKRLV